MKYEVVRSLEKEYLFALYKIAIRVSREKPLLHHNCKLKDPVYFSAFNYASGFNG